MSIDSDVIRGHVDTIILKTLTTGDKYGYEIIKEIEQKSQGTYELKQPTLYSCLKRLENQGYITAYWKNSDIGGKRHYYKLTKKGRESYDNSMQDWFNSRYIIDSLMGSKPTVLEKAEDGEDISIDKLAESEGNEFASENDDNPVLPETVGEADTAQLNIFNNDDEKPSEDYAPRDFEIDDLDEKDAELLSDYYKTDENQIDLFSNASTPQPTENPNDSNEDESYSIFKGFEGADLSKYKKNENENYFDSIAYGVADADNVTVDNKNLETPTPETIITPEPENTEPENNFRFFTNYPMNDDDGEIEDESTPPEEPVSSGKLHFGFSDTSNEDDGDFVVPNQFMDVSNIDNSAEDDDVKPVSIFGEDTLNSSNASEASNAPELKEWTSQESDLAPFNLGTYTDPEHKEKLNQLSSYTKNNYDTVKRVETTSNAPQEALSYDDLKANMGSLGIEVREYTKPTITPIKERKKLLVNKIKFATSWIVCLVMLATLALTYLIANNTGLNNLDMVETSLPAFIYYIFAGIVTLVLPIFYTIVYLNNKTKKVTPKYSALISLIFACLFFIVCLNIIYTFNILNGFTKFSQKDYNHLLWLLPSVDSLIIVFQSIVYSILYKTKRFNV